MSTLLYKALIEANVSEETATAAAKEIDNYRLDVLSMKQDLAALKARTDILLVGIGILIALGIIDKFL